MEQRTNKYNSRKLFFIMACLFCWQSYAGFEIGNGNTGHFSSPQGRYAFEVDGNWDVIFDEVSVNLRAPATEGLSTRINIAPLNLSLDEVTELIKTWLVQPGWSLMQLAGYQAIRKDMVLDGGMIRSDIRLLKPDGKVLALDIMAKHDPKHPLKSKDLEQVFATFKID